MLKTKTDQWWVVVVQGILALAFGAIAITHTGATALVLFIWFAILAVGDGLLHIILAFQYRAENERWRLTLLRGIAGIGIGLLVFVWPRLTALIFIYFIAARAIVDGFFGISFALQWRQALRQEWLAVLGGALAIVFGVWLFFQPFIGGLTARWIIGLCALLIGIMRFIEGFRIRLAGPQILIVFRLFFRNIKFLFCHRL
jgi:uncharacterized membrane protein HdeD (DUF308 family)